MPKAARKKTGVAENVKETAIRQGKAAALAKAYTLEEQSDWKRTPVLHLPLSKTTDRNFHLLAEALPHIIWTAEPDGTVDYMNSRWFEYTGLTEEETYAETRTAVHPDDVADYRRRWKEATRTQEPYEIEYRFRRASDGIYRWHLGRGVPVKDELGNVLKWFGTCTDIHDQKQAEAEVRRLNEDLERKVRERTIDLEHEMRERMDAEERVRSNLELMKTMIDTMPMAAVAADRHHQILHCNEHFQQLFAPQGAARALAGTDCIALISSPDEKFNASESYDRMLMAILRNKTESLRQEIVTKEGRVYSFDYLPIMEGSFHRGYLLLYRDISQEKRINRAKTEFMSLASHQLRTPLTAVRWALNRLWKRLNLDMEPQDLHLLERARTAVEGMASTITTMLSISRIEAGMLSPKISSVSLKYFLADVCADFRDMCAAKQQILSLDCPEELVVDVDVNLLREIIENLISNSMKYTPAGGQIFVGAVKTDNNVAISVRDNGYGIPKSQQHKIFSKFFRADNVIQVDTEGTGLGLYLVSQLVQLLGGTIEFISTEGRGTTFTVVLKKQEPLPVQKSD